MDEKKINLILCIVTCIAFIVSWCLILFFSRKFNFNQLIKLATDKSQLNPTEFYIFDRSTKDQCDRFIIIKPFYWYVWCINNRVYIINDESSNNCNPSSTPIIQVHKDHFTEGCLDINLKSLIEYYTNLTEPIIKSYEIETETFTILSALNILFKEYITISKADNVNQNTNNIISNFLVQNRFKRSINKKN